MNRRQKNFGVRLAEAVRAYVVTQTRAHLKFLLILLVALIVMPTVAHAQHPSSFSGPASHKKSLVEGAFGYSFGFNDILLRDGDNANFAPEKKEIGLDSMVFSVQGQTFVTSDVAVRVQGWINIPQEIRSNFILDGVTRSWDTQARQIEADLAAIYVFGFPGIPYAAGLTVGYRYCDLNYSSVQVAVPSGTFHDHFQIHIPYLGVYYTHHEFAGSIVRLDVLASAFPLSRLDSQRRQQLLITEIEGQSVTGFWFETLFEWTSDFSGGAQVGLMAKYNYLELSGGATVRNGIQSTSFSMDSRKHLFVTGLTVGYRF